MSKISCVTYSTTPSPISSETERKISFSSSAQSSSLCSLNPINWIQRFFSFFISIFSWLFSFCKKSPKAFSLQKISPGPLATHDPFFKLVFNPDGALRFPKAFDETIHLFQFLGTTHYISWITHVRWLQKKEKEVKDLQSHPLSFLYFLLYSKEMTKCVENLRDQATRGSWILRLKTGRDPWEEFLRQQVKSMEKRTDNLKYLPGFCRALNIDESKVREIAKQKNWHELVLWVFQQRKDQFNL